jgi:hypothetical protein
MASLLDLAQARLGGLLAPRPSMAGLLGGQRTQGNLASALQGYTPPQMTAMTNPQVMDYARNVAQTAQQNLQTQMSDLDKALVMDQGGINVGDRQALARLMEQVPGLMGATAYHGTPHNIRGKFDISKVGTGEGAQAYGHGMYFAENPAVAEAYALTIPKNVNKEAYDAENIAKRLFIGGFDEKYITNRIKSVLPNADDKIIANAVETAKTRQVGGNLYKVDIPDADIPNMLNWDLPISQQPKSVQKAFQSIIKKDVSPEGMDIGGAKILDNRNSQADPTQVQPWVMKSGDTMFGLTQKDVDQLISNETAKGLYGKLAADLGSQKAASEYLQSQGVKGIKYLDQGSRGKSGTYNFVVFDPADVKILEKNSQKVEGLLD